jgi:hypothetical protein
VDSNGTKLLYTKIRADRNIQDPDRYGDSHVAVAILGFRRNLMGQLSMVTGRVPCDASEAGTTARYLRIAASIEHAKPLPTPYFTATWSTQFATRMNDLKANAGRQFINSIKSAVPVLAPILEGDKK